MELSSAKIKKVLIFSQKKISLYIAKWNFSKKLLTFQEGTFRAQKIKKPTQKKFLIFREMELFSPKLKKLLYFFQKKKSDISGGNLQRLRN